MQRGVSMSDRRSREWTLRELAAAAGVAERTIRYHISLGILPPPLRGGRSAAYGETHKAGIEAVRRLQAKGLTLAEIAHELALEGGPAPRAGPRRYSPSAKSGGGEGERRMLWFDMDGSIDKGAHDEGVGPLQEGKRRGLSPCPESVIDRALARPETWRSYEIAPDVRILFKTGASPWRTKRLLSALRRFAGEIMD
jgi:DNA-binding transcriptional MerR regulator